MSIRNRDDWSHHIDQIIRSRHYTWLAEGLGGTPLDEALTVILTDLHHICERTGRSWEDLLAESQTQFEQEEEELLLATA